MCELPGHSRNRSAVCQPSRRGIMRSSVMTFGAIVGAFFRQSCPSTPVATSNPSSARLAAISRRMTSPSSTTRTRPRPRVSRVRAVIACGAVCTASDPRAPAAFVPPSRSVGQGLRAGSLAIVDLASVTDLDDKHYQFAVTHFVYDAVVANADTQPAALASQCLDAGRSGLSAQSLGGALDTTRYLAVKLAELSQRCRAACPTLSGLAQRYGVGRDTLIRPRRLRRAKVSTFRCGRSSGTGLSPPSAAGSGRRPAGPYQPDGLACRPGAARAPARAGQRLRRGCRSCGPR
jgi:hypothetical protein